MKFSPPHSKLAKKLAYFLTPLLSHKNVHFRVYFHPKWPEKDKKIEFWINHLTLGIQTQWLGVWYWILSTYTISTNHPVWVQYCQSALFAHGENHKKSFGRISREFTHLRKKCSFGEKIVIIFQKIIDFIKIFWWFFTCFRAIFFSKL